MESALITAALLACPVGMGLMMWWMARSNRQASATSSRPEELRAEHARISRQIDELERQDPPEAPVGRHS